MVRRHVLNGTKNVAVTGISLADCSRRSADVAGLTAEKAWSAAQFASKLHTFGSEIAEGFFSKCVVLVEGAGDKAVLEAWYTVNGRDPYAEGIVIAEVSGKNNLAKPIIVFQALGIPCYWIFDNDKAGKKQKLEHSAKTNKLLQRLAGVSACTDWPKGCFSQFAAWDDKLEEYTGIKVGKDQFGKVATEFAEHFDIDADMCLKFPTSASGMLLRLRAQGYTFPELDEILSAIDPLLA